MRLAYLTPKKQYLTKMSRVRFHQIRAIAELCDVVWSGPGWHNYNDNISVKENLLKIYCNELPDMVVVFDHRSMIKLNEVPVPKCVIMNEMHDPNGNKKLALDLIVEQKYDLIVCHHLNEMCDNIFKPIINKCYNLSHCANENIFKDYELDKSIDVLACGNLRFEKYSLRRRFPEIINMLNEMGHTCKIYQHPGGFHNDSHTDKYLIDFAKAINESKICLTCSSVYKCSFGKYVEIPMCKSLLAGDLPDERHEFFKKFMLVLDENDSNENIVKKIDNQLKNKEDLCYKTKIGYELSKKNYKMSDYAKRFLHIVKNFFDHNKKYNNMLL